MKENSHVNVRIFFHSYILGKTQAYDIKKIHEALAATAAHRGSFDRIKENKIILEQIAASDDLQKMWTKYKKKFKYAADISYENIISVIRSIITSNSQ